MEIGEEEKKAIEDSKELINELGKHKDKDFIGRLYYKNRPIEDTLRLLLNIIERQQEEIDTWEETENDYEHELARNNEQIKKQQKEIEEKRIIIFAGAEKVKQLEKGNRSLMESRIKWKNRYYKEKAKNKDYISKDKIKEKIKKAKEIKRHTPKLVIEYFEELLEENNEESDPL